ncbi:MAG: hypothetical protein OZ921_02665 [Sorangiineae bacterium]|nr:hypothetical protein [Polyangiaceae bacterium]MEB2321389.1 hypothetical protein [Sorangiineae bacterium]
MSTEDACKLFVAGLPDSISEDGLRELFEELGVSVANVSLPRDRSTGRPRGFGFVTLATPAEAERARASLDGSLQSGRPMSVRPFQSEPPRRGESRGDAGPGPSPGAAGGDRTLYVGNLPYDANSSDIETLFRELGAGPVARVHLPVGPDGRPRGFGFITLPSAEAAASALDALRDAEFRGRRLMINIAHPRGERSERPERSRAPRREEGGGGPEHRERFAPPPIQAPDAVDPRRAEGRRRATKPERTEADNRKKRGAGARAKGEEPNRRGRSGWQDWDDED